MIKQHYNELINELAELCGILPEYWDIFGKKHLTSLDTKKAVLRAMKIRINSVDDVEREINERKWRPWKNFIEPVHVLSINNQPFEIPIYIPIREAEESKITILWSIGTEIKPATIPVGKVVQGGFLKDSSIISEFQLTGEAFDISEIQWIDGLRYIKINLADTEHRDIGYYTLKVECRHPDKIFPNRSNVIQKNSKIILTPDTCYIPSDLKNGRTWGLSVNLYAVRSNLNWGVGDFSDLKRIVTWIADLNGGFICINPIHAIPNTKPFGISPYSPISRLYKNFIYLDVENVLEVKELENDGIAMIDNIEKELKELRTGDLVDYEKTAELKEKVLREAFEIFYKKHYIRNTVRGMDFRTYISEEGNSLEYFAVYMALASQHGGIKNWKEWPGEYHNIASENIRVFRNKNKREILFYQYIQWLIDRQQEEIADEAKNCRMKLGVYHDLAIGYVNGGSDAWTYQNVIAGEADVGAPPDDFSPNGQNWGFPPLIPEMLKETGYDLFIQTMRKNMKYAGALRIDHALGLFRLFWIPHGMSPQHGAYIGYPSEDLLRIIALESNRNKTMVIAEDLGTIGENVQKSLKRFQMLSYRLFYFERNYPEPSLLSPEKYPKMALCAVTTHDLPTLYGYWMGRDIQVKGQLGQYSDDTVLQKSMDERERDKKLILSALQSYGVIEDDYISDSDTVPEMNPELCLAVYHYLALTPCKLLLVSLEDIIGTIDQQNMPGTVGSYPNWMQKTPMPLEDMISDKRFLDLADILNRTLQK